MGGGGGGGGGTEFPQSEEFKQLERSRQQFEEEQADFEQLMFLYQTALSNQAAQARAQDIGLFTQQLSNPFGSGFDAALAAAGRQQEFLLGEAGRFDEQAASLQGVLSGLQAPTLDVRSISPGFGDIPGFGGLSPGGGLQSLFPGGFGAGALGGTTRLPVRSFRLPSGEVREGNAFGDKGEAPFLREASPEVVQTFQDSLARGEITLQQLALSQAYRIASGIPDTRFFSPDFGGDFALGVARQAEQGLLPQQQQQRQFLANLQEQQEEALGQFRTRQSELRGQISEAQGQAAQRRREAEATAGKANILQQRRETASADVFERFFETQRVRSEIERNRAQTAAAQAQARSAGRNRLVRGQLQQLDKSRSRFAKPLRR